MCGAPKGRSRERVPETEDSGTVRPAEGEAGSQGWQPRPGRVRSPGQSQMEGLGRESRATAQGLRRPGRGRVPGGVQEDVGCLCLRKGAEERKGLGADCGFCTQPSLLTVGQCARAGFSGREPQGL